MQRLNFSQCFSPCASGLISNYVRTQAKACAREERFPRLAVSRMVSAFNMAVQVTSTVLAQEREQVQMLVRVTAPPLASAVYGVLRFGGSVGGGIMSGMLILTSPPPNPSIERTHNGSPLQAFISFWALRSLPLCAAHVKR